MHTTLTIGCTCWYMTACHQQWKRDLVGKGFGCPSVPTEGRLGAPVRLQGRGFGCPSAPTGERFWVPQCANRREVVGAPVRLQGEVLGAQYLHLYSGGRFECPVHLVGGGLGAQYS